MTIANTTTKGVQHSLITVPFNPLFTLGAQQQQQYADAYYYQQAGYYGNILLRD